MNKLVLIRHGQSEWNLENRFTGWEDVDLSEKGRAEAIQAGRLLAESGFTFDMAYTSVLKRAIKTLHLVLEEMDALWIPEIKVWQLNERYYGALQGLNKADTIAKYSAEQVLIWRRSFTVPPPAVTEDDIRAPFNDIRYAGVDPSLLPLTESLETMMKRVIPYYQNEISPALKSGKHILIAAHGNTLRGLVKYLDQLSDQDIVNYEVPTGVPLVYEMDDSFMPLRKYFLHPQNQEGAI
ncbi:2,3-bisphosphoglycerate-dependent phosphoglycerate mutase [Pedobacter cryoconitis]|uniref:2,3-diphosphoglycerate-dependent phosphoglycerate mutase n=1 Tax=Pedobacter cryoconitis TaxID=188932 RepID=UPI0016130C29|nr:2,3-diphosphoglycerate-dependent phosphoglycerate mutase [Pedobacter cryoconitis]MBB6272101.1 2,3-bisphosphoglycerate-dependent phosphoglycerate mutase [Pedobacter cryoconitis]